MKVNAKGKWFRLIHDSCVAPMNSSLIILADVYHRIDIDHDYLTLHHIDYIFRILSISFHSFCEVDLCAKYDILNELNLYLLLILNY